mmetsp:Transcript_11509/g.11152  ORF Transcript_11509/g.11152 Transcript_11509/m.11152 type:complete len:685 (-) Transcript_11509:48-2102(-)
MSTSKVSPTTYWYTDLSWANWLVTVANTVDPPLVFSISYGQEEQTLTTSELDAFNTEAIKLGVMGVTIVAASGDDGANSRSVRVNRGGTCGYVASFPASSPYVTAVGATQGIESTDAGVFNGGEVTCSSNTQGVITTGGGFSAYYSRSEPAFQNTAVDNYLLKVKGTAKDPEGGFNVQGRGYPDLSAAGLSYSVILNGRAVPLSGTSASSPVIAGLFSNINAKRLAAGKGALGWVNPTLYQTYTQYTNDITEGDNLCVVGPVCCQEGFHAAVGWDPTTGLGSVNYGKMEATLVALGDNVNKAFTFAPSLVPTPFPTGPTKEPTPSPSASPTTSIGNISLIAGTGVTGFDGDGQSAVLALLNQPLDIAIGASGDIYIADTGNHRIRMIRNGIISTVAGNGFRGYSGDSFQATAASIDTPVGLAVDGPENIYIADSFNHVIRKVLKETGIIITIVGNSFQGFGGDGSLASSITVLLNRPLGVAFGASGNLYILDSSNNRIRMVRNSIITTVAGTGVRGYNGEGQALSSQLFVPLGIAEDVLGDIYIADTFNHRIRVVIKSSGMIKTIAGTGISGYSGDGFNAELAQLSEPNGVALDSSGNIFIADFLNNRIRMVLKSTGIITTIATQVGPIRIQLNGNNKIFFTDDANKVMAVSDSGSPDQLSSGSSKLEMSSTVMTACIGLFFIL